MDIHSLVNILSLSEVYVKGTICVVCELYLKHSGRNTAQYSVIVGIWV